MICGCIGIVAEVSYEALRKRYDQGWVMEIADNLDHLVKRTKELRDQKKVMCFETNSIQIFSFPLALQVSSIGYHGNVVDVWERFVQHWVTYIFNFNTYT